MELAQGPTYLLWFEEKKHITGIIGKEKKVNSGCLCNN